MTVHIDRAHHHPKVYKSRGRWRVECPRCGSFNWSADPTWRNAMTVALHHAWQALS